MSEQPKKLSTKSIILITVILPVVVIIISSIAIVITARSAAEQKTFDISQLDALPPVIENAPDTAEKAAELTESLITDAVSSGLLKFTGNVTASFQDIKTENESITSVLSFAAASMSAKCTELYETVSNKYGEDASHITELLPGGVPDEFTAEINDGVLVLTMSYTKVFPNMYFLNDDSAAVKMFRLSNSGVFSSVNESFTPGCCVFTLSADCSDGRIISYSVDRSYSYSSHITFVNSLEAAGSVNLEMKLAVREDYSFSYAGIAIEQTQISLTENGYEALTVTPFVEEGLSEDEYSLEFISSDPSVVTVDANGQIEAVKISDKPVEVSVKLHYLGKDFSDSCTVYVVKAVERVNISETELTLKTGSEFTLSAEVTPDDATVKTVEYYSSDESVARVTKDGKVTAVGKGTAVISAVNVQALIASECTVTVTE